MQPPFTIVSIVNNAVERTHYFNIVAAYLMYDVFARREDVTSVALYTRHCGDPIMVFNRKAALAANQCLIERSEYKGIEVKENAP